MPGEIVHIEIPADDTEQAREFWGSLFGWQFEAYPGPSEYHMARLADQQGAAITNMEPGKRGTPAYFSVDDLNPGAGERVGGRRAQPWRVRTWGWSGPSPAPHGTEFGLGQIPPSAPAPTG